MSIRYITQPSQPRQGRTQVTTSAKPITQVGASSANTTFTATTVVSSSAWDLSAVEANKGYVVTTSGGWKGEITGVDDAADTITVRAWVKDGPGDTRAAALPAAGETAIIHKAAHCQKLIIDAIEANTAVIDIGFSSSVTSGTGHPLSSTAENPNSRIILEAQPKKLLDLTQTYAIAGSTQNIAWIAM
jgi:hypothetical protein